MTCPPGRYAPLTGRQAFRLGSMIHQGVPVDKHALYSIGNRLTVCVTGAGAGVDSAWEQEKLKARKMHQDLWQNADYAGLDERQLTPLPKSIPTASVCVKDGARAGVYDGWTCLNGRARSRVNTRLRRACISQPRSPISL